MSRLPAYPGLILCALPVTPAGAQPDLLAERLCDPKTNVCFCTGGWNSADCTAMTALCEPGYWRACSGDVCSCTKQTWVHPARPADAADTLPADRQRKP